MATSAAVYDVERLKQFYAAGFHDAFLDNALRKIVDRQIARDQADLQRVNDMLAQFERQYGFTSDEFWQRFQVGQMDDSADFMEWNAFCKMQRRIASRLRILTGNGGHE